MTAYYNEIDPFAAAWLRKLIEQGHVAPGDVDERSIEDVHPDDLKPYRQCHFFAGIGVWSYALRLAGWPDDRRIWTGSCPCQPFSAAGKGGGFDDERHLWPAWFHLVTQLDPTVLVGEQVASKDGLAWLDLIRADLEGSGRTFGAADLCAAGFGAPHIRQRNFFVALADAGSATREWDTRKVLGTERAEAGRRVDGYIDGGEIGRLADTNGRNARPERQQRGGEQRQLAAHGGAYERVDDAQREGSQGHAGDDRPAGGREEPGRSVTPASVSGGVANAVDGPGYGGIAWPVIGVDANGTGAVQTLDGPPGPTNGFWREADWLFSRDGRWRPVEPGTFPLVNGAPSRVGRLRGYGNAIVAPVAQGFVEIVMELIDEQRA